MEQHIWADQLLAWVDRKRRWLMGAVVLIYLAGCNGQWRVEPDGGLYLTLARNLAEGRGFTYHYQRHGLAYPGFPVFLAGVRLAFPGLHSRPLDLVAENLILPALALVTLALAYWMLKLAAGRPLAVLATVSLALTHTYYRASFSILTDIPFLLGVTAFLAGHQSLMHRATRPWLAWTLMVVGTAIALFTRPTWVAFVPAAAVALIEAARWRATTWKSVAAFGVVGCVLIAVFFVTDPRRGAPPTEVDYQNTVLSALHTSGIMATIATNIRDIFLQYTPSAIIGIKLGPDPDSAKGHAFDYLGYAVSFIVSAAILVAAFSISRRHPAWAVWIAGTLGMMVGFLPLERYYLQAGPMLMLGCWSALVWLNRRIGSAANLVFALLAALLIVPNLTQVGAMIVEQRQTPFLAHYHHGSYLPLIDAAAEIKKLPADAVVQAPTKTERFLTYLSNRIVYELPEPEPPSDGPHYLLRENASGKLELSVLPSEPRTPH